MKIVLAIGLYPPEIGGPATYAAMLESELPKEGVEVVAVPFGWVRRYPKAVRHIVFGWKLWQALKTADAIYALDPVQAGLPSRWVARLARKPFVVRLSGDYAWEQGRMHYGVRQTLDEYSADRRSAPWQVRLLAKLQSYVVSRASVVVVPSKYLQSIVSQWGIAGEKIQVVHSALYPLPVDGRREVLRAQLEYTYPTLVSAARLVPWKGFRVLIDTVHSLRERFPDISLIIIGEGEERKKLEKQVASLGLSEQVRFTSRISKEALGASLKAADVFVLNTAYEGLSHQLIEVMDLGVPIVTTKSGGNPELITDGVNGYLVDFNDQEQLQEAIIRVISHPESRERMTQSARLRSKDFQKNSVVQRMAHVLKTALSQK
jgi:glycosyltransferase involved in cell wall biosynthesis